MAEGFSKRRIAERLVVSVHTVRNHIASLSAKLGAHSKLEALSIAVPGGCSPAVTTLDRSGGRSVLPKWTPVLMRAEGPYN